MTVFVAAFRFESSYLLRGPLFYIFLLLMAAMAGGIASALAYAPHGALLINAPRHIATVSALLCPLAFIVPLIHAAGAALRDAESRMDELIRASPISMASYLLGHFAGALIITGLIFFVALFAFEAGCRLWWIDAAAIGPFQPLAYLRALAAIVLPNIFVLSAIFFSVAIWTRRAQAGYLAFIAYFILAIAANSLSSAIHIAEPLLEPTGLKALLTVTGRWTTSEVNTKAVPLLGWVAWNRLLWTGIGIGLLTFAIALYPRREPARQRQRASKPVSDGPAVFSRLPIVPIGGAGLKEQVLSCIRLEVRRALRNWTFPLLALLVAAACVLVLIYPNQETNIPLLPVTSTIAVEMGELFAGITLLFAILFCGEMVWRERKCNIDGIVDATPTPSLVFILAKLTAMAVLIGILCCLVIIVGIGFQLSRGYTHIDFITYLIRFFVLDDVPLLLVAVLAIFAHALANHRYGGHVLTVALVAIIVALAQLGVENNLVLFAGAPDVPFSEMNGTGHYLKPAIWFLIYWSWIAALLVMMAHALWVRGSAAPFFSRLRNLYTAIPSHAPAFSIVILGACTTGGYIYWNTHIRNAYHTEASNEQFLANYEKTYKPLLGVPQPRISEIEIAVDLAPETRSYTSRGRYTLVNRSTADIETVYVQFDRNVNIGMIELEGAGLEGLKREGSNFAFRLKPPMARGESRTLTFSSSVHSPGFKNSGDGALVQYNGTFLHDSKLAPWIGGWPDLFLKDEKRRRRHDLRSLTDETNATSAGLHNNFLRSDSDFVRFAITVSTNPDQIAIAPGYLQKEWTEGGRRFFRYEMDKPIVNFWSVVSAHYAVARDNWNGVDLAVYFHPPHSTHVPRMIAAMKEALEYYTVNFGPFQNRQIRIAEFPYGNFAQSFPNTVPFSEKLGFIYDDRVLKNFDYVGFVTAHEVAHQWWAHQVTPAGVPGAQLLSESLAEYSALVVMERRYGAARIREYLKRELDIYFKGRGTGDNEKPLNGVRMEQGYIAYNKGAVALYALKDEIGETAINRALARFVREYAYKSDPYPSAADLIRLLREEAGPEHRQLIADLFEKITLWDLGVTKCSATPMPGGKWRVSVTLRARKLEATEKGEEKEVPMNNFVDIGLFSSNPADTEFLSSDVILLQRQRLVSGNQTIEFIVSRKPAFAGINPYNKLIERNTDDNILALQ
jgi:hypothetical protein